MDDRPSLTSDAVEAWLSMLRAMNVEEFEFDGFRVKFKPGDPPPEDINAVIQDIAKDEARAKPKSIWTDPKLWPGGAPPDFDE